MIEVPNELSPKIGVVYPAENYQIFEEWFAEQDIPKTEREYLPVFFTSFYVNNQYGQDAEANSRLHSFLQTLDKSKKYYTIIQYDDGSMIDWESLGIDMIEFNMSKNKGVEIPLLCMPHSFKGSDILGGGRIFQYSFIGSRTHPIRDKLLSVKHPFDTLVTDLSYDIDKFCDTLSMSTFGLCPRGYGLNSFRVVECMQYGAIPVYISDYFIEPFGIDFSEYGVKIKEEEIEILPEILQSYSAFSIESKRKRMKELYESRFTYEGVFNRIIKILQNE